MKSRILRIGKSSNWKDDFFYGYQTVEFIALSKGIVIPTADEQLEHPARARYSVDDYEEMRRELPNSSTAYLFGKACAMLAMNKASV